MIGVRLLENDGHPTLAAQALAETARLVAIDLVGFVAQREPGGLADGAAVDGGAVREQPVGVGAHLQRAEHLERGGCEYAEEEDAG
jgi:hypothetical protein